MMHKKKFLLFAFSLLSPIVAFGAEQVWYEGQEYPTLMTYQAGEMVPASIFDPRIVKLEKENPEKTVYMQQKHLREIRGKQQKSRTKKS